MKISTAEFLISNTDVSKCPQQMLPEYAFVGRSNVGKSSLINMLTGRKGLAMTSATPGKTMLINHFIVNKEWFLVDLPGYGYAKRGQKAMEQLRRMITDYVLRRQQLTCLFVLIDSRLAPQKNDIGFVNFLGENGVPFAIVFTKVDKQSRSKTSGNVQTWLEKMRETWEELPPVFLTSSLNGDGRDGLLQYIEDINKSLSDGASVTERP